MAYEYESKLRNYLIGHKNANPKFDGFEILEILEEIKEVYRKAKAFDHIKVIYDKNMNEMSISDAECIEMIGNELEGADDER